MDWHSADEAFTTADVHYFFYRLENEIAGNAWQDYLFAAGIAAVLLLAVLYLRFVLHHRLTTWQSKSSQNIGMALTTRTVSAFFELLEIIPFYAACKVLEFSPELRGAIWLIFLLLFTWRSVIFFSRFFVAVLNFILSHSSNYVEVLAVAPIITFIVWAIGIIFILDNLGVKISSIAAGLGIAGVAVGLTRQVLSGNFFGYLAIFMDLPFKRGDTVFAMNGSSGTIEQVGLKTTKVRQSTGELILVPNSDLSKSTLINTTAWLRHLDALSTST